MKPFDMRIRFAVSIASFSSLAGGFTKVEWTWTICYVSVNSKTTYQPVPALPMVFKLAARNIKAAKCQVPLARNNGHTFTHSRQHPDTKANDQLAGSICDKRRTPWSQPEVLCCLPCAAVNHSCHCDTGAQQHLIHFFPVIYNIWWIS